MQAKNVTKRNPSVTAGKSPRDTLAWLFSF
jgi:hypothetical protein